MPINTQNPPTVPFLDPNGRVSREWWKFLFNLTQSSNQVASGTVETASGSGLTGGGVVSDGISLSIAANGVTNSMLRQSLGTSVIGRFAGSTGNVADIQAVSDGTVLTRQGGILLFTDDVDVASVRTDSFRIDQSPVAETVVCTHTITISVDGTNYKIPCVAA